MSQESGHIQLPRYAFDEDPLLDKKPWHTWMFWQYLIFLATWQPNGIKVRIGGRTVTLRRGQLFQGERWLGERPGWKRHRVHDELDRLEADGRIVMQRGQLGTLVTIVNYDRWQGGNADKGPRKCTHEATPQNGATNGASIGTIAKSVADTDLTSRVGAGITTNGATNGATTGPRRGHLVLQDTMPSEVAEPNKVKKVKKEEKKEETTSMTELPDIVTEPPDLVVSASRIVHEFQAALPPGAKGKIRPPSPVEFDRVIVAIRRIGGAWMGLRDWVGEFTRRCPRAPHTIAYPLAAWENEQDELDRVRRKAGEATAPMDAKVRALVAGLAGSMGLPEESHPQEKTTRVTAPALTPEEERATRSWQDQREKDREAAATEPELTDTERVHIVAQAAAVVARLSGKPAREPEH